MAIKIYRVKIEGWVVQNDLGGPGPELTPVGWGAEAIVKAMGSDAITTETLVDTIEEEEKEDAQD